MNLFPLYLNQRENLLYLDSLLSKKCSELNRDGRPWPKKSHKILVGVPDIFSGHLGLVCLQSDFFFLCKWKSEKRNVRNCVNTRITTMYGYQNDVEHFIFV